ncbi:hypothetical protein ALC57_15189 [Trachymyrmex cornetzi]|uniref:Uncharacterized protein n=1 Tax=Trachymyrmex cornetzi TaxID=471704 RepID=A0A195DHZ7_9HYME|nr:hypothetical protein ALC57_15189 [Trachymyrmex cornetzi]
MQRLRMHSAKTAFGGGCILSLLRESPRFFTRAIPCVGPINPTGTVRRTSCTDGIQSGLIAVPDVVPQRLGRGITRCYMRSSSFDSGRTGQTFDNTQAWGGPATVGSRDRSLARSLGALAANTTAPGTHVGAFPVLTCQPAGNIQRGVGCHGTLGRLLIPEIYRINLLVHI